MKRLVFLQFVCFHAIALTVALIGCQGGDGGTPAPTLDLTLERPGGGWESNTGRAGAGLASVGLVSEGAAENPFGLTSAPTSHRGVVGAAGNSYYVVSTGPGRWEATLADLNQEAALFVYGSTDFSSPTLCSTASFQTSRETCAVTCNDSSCSFGLRVYGFDGGGTPFLLSVQ